MTRTRTVVFGSGAFALPVLDAVASHPRLEVVAVVVPRPRPAGRHGVSVASPVATRAAELGLPVVELMDLGPEAQVRIAGLRPELGVLADYGRIVPQALLDLPRHGILNVHPSLLPRHRGASPIPATILAGDETTGVTIIRMDAGVDTGPIVAAEPLPVRDGVRAPELEHAAAATGAGLLARTVGPWLDGGLPAVPQPAVGATRTRTLERTDGRLDPGRSATELERQVRAYDPWPGTYLETTIGRIAVHRAAVASSQPGDAGGAFVPAADGLALATTDGRLELLEVRPAGGRTMSGAAFRRGRPGVIGAMVIVA